MIRTLAQQLQRLQPGQYLDIPFSVMDQLPRHPLEPNRDPAEVLMDSTIGGGTLICDTDESRQCYTFTRPPVSPS